MCDVTRYQSKAFREEMTKEYLAERSQYRSTGIPKKYYRRGHATSSW